MNTPNRCRMALPRGARSPWLPVVVLLFAACVVPKLVAQATLIGTVTNSATRQSLEGARVIIKGTNREAFTDSQGAYRFDDLTPGDVLLSVSYTGLDTADVSVPVSTGASNRR